MANGILDFAVYVAFFFFLLRNAKQCSTIENTLSRIGQIQVRETDTSELLKRLEGNEL